MTGSSEQRTVSSKDAGATHGKNVIGFTFTPLLYALCSVGALLLALSIPATAQQPANVPRVGVLLPWSPASGVSLSFLKAFGDGLYDAGYLEGRNLTITHRYAEGASKLFPKLAAELVRLNVDIIVTTAGPPSRAAKLATQTIPIVFTQVTDPVAEGLVASLARPGGNMNTHRTRIVELAAKHRLPTMFAERTHVESGGLMSYAPSFSDLQRRAATYVDKILKGARPADLPVEQPTKFELVINLKTAKQIGITIPPNVVARADRVIR